MTQVLTKNLLSQESTLQILDRQIGGHGTILSLTDSIVIKPCSNIEKDFYENSVLYPDFAEWIPKFYGSLQLGDVLDAQYIKEISLQYANGVDKAVCLENLLYKFKQPCIMDWKLGTQLWGEDVSEAKRQKLTKIANETTSGPFGIRVTAYQVYQKSTDSYFNFTKKDGYELTTADTIVSALAKFFTAEISTNNRRLIIERFLDDIESYLKVLKKQEIRFIGTSLFFVYEGDPDALAEALKKEQEYKEQENKEQENKEQENKEQENKEQENKEQEVEYGINGEQDDDINIENIDDYAEEEEDSDPDDEDIFKITDLKVIDFAHSFFRKGIEIDEGCLLGLNNTIDYFKQILKEKKYR